MQKFLGVLTILVCVFGGYMWAGGKLGAIWQPAEFLIIIGAAAGSLIIGNPPTRAERDAPTSTSNHQRPN